MLISESMRRGAKMGPQLFGHFGDRNGGSCGIGAIALGSGLITKETLGFQMGKDMREALFYMYPDLKKEVNNPVIKGYCEDLAQVIMRLNDIAHWTRERIAGWIEAQVETPTYSLLDLQHYMNEPQEAPKEAACVREHCN